MAPQKQTWAWRSSHDVLCAINETHVGLSMLASTLLVGACAWNGMFSQRGFMRRCPNAKCALTENKLHRAGPDYSSP